MKVFLPAALLAVCAFTTGCTGSSTKAEGGEKSLKEKIETCTDADSLAVYVKQAKHYADSLAKAGKPDEAMKFMDELTPAVEKQAPSLKEQWKAAVEQVGTATTNAADSVGSKVGEFTDSVKSKSEDIAGKVKDKSVDVYDKTKNKTADIYNKAKDGVKDGAKDVKDATENVVDKLKGK